MSDRGQATVELTALLPLLAVVAVTAYTVLASHTAAEQAGAAAEAGAIALLQDADPRAAARDALPKAMRSRAAVELDDTRVRVAVRPRVPLFARRLEAHATADAGPAPKP
jgi:hypothetical protein